MPPDDPTPLGDAMTHRFPQQKIPEFEPGSAEARQREQSTDMARRPALPDHPRPMVADLGDDAGGQRPLVRPTVDRIKPPARQRG
jgi:hypothetical protein